MISQRLTVSVKLLATAAVASSKTFIDEIICFLQVFSHRCSEMYAPQSYSPINGSPQQKETAILHYLPPGQEVQLVPDGSSRRHQLQQFRPPVQQAAGEKEWADAEWEVVGTLLRGSTWHFYLEIKV